MSKVARQPSPSESTARRARELPAAFGRTQLTEQDFTPWQENGNAVHGHESHVRGPEDRRRLVATYYGMVSRLDKYVGLILDRLDELRLARDTVVVSPPITGISSVNMRYRRRGLSYPAGRFWACTLTTNPAPGGGFLPAGRGLGWSPMRGRCTTSIPPAADGGIWVAMANGWSVRRYRADATLDRILHLPVQKVTSYTFGGPDLADLYITSASIGLSQQEATAQPHAGAVFRCRPGVAGLPPNAFHG